MSNFDNDSKSGGPFKPDALRSVDFEALYRMQYARSGLEDKKAGDWTMRAPEWARTHDQKNSYIRELSRRLNLEDCHSLLDIGCGSGGLILSLSTRLERCVGIDFSRGMLAEFRVQIERRDLDNVATALLAWDDDWSGLEPADLVVASRSIGGVNLPERLDKMTQFARKRAALTYRTGQGFLPDDVFAAMGRKREPRPHYMYIMNMLYERGLQAELEFIESAKPPALYMDAESFLERMRWSLGDLSPDDERNLIQYYEQLPLTEAGGHLFSVPTQWALIQWTVASDA